jgi:hypothetical protein
MDPGTGDIPGGDVLVSGGVIAAMAFLSGSGAPAFAAEPLHGEVADRGKIVAVGHVADPEHDLIRALRAGHRLTCAVLVPVDEHDRRAALRDGRHGALELLQFRKRPR